MKKIILLNLTAFALVFFTACEDERVKPIFDIESGDFTPASIDSPLTGALGTLDPEAADELLETFSWEPADFGAAIPTRYSLEMAIGASDARTDGEVIDPFATLVVVGTTSATSLDVTVNQFNNAMLGLGATEGEELTVLLRIKAEAIGQDIVVYSETMERTATAFRLSNCGNWCSMGLIGDATPGGWDNDTDMWLADAGGLDKNTWRIVVYLTAANAKFRTGDQWANNWGGSGLSGTAVAGGGDIPISTAGWYRVEFNDNTLEYSFTLLTPTVFTSIGIIGDATPGGWDADTDLADLGVTGGHVWQASSAITMTAAFSKFRANDDWANNWGSTGYPSGIGTPGGDNIPTTAGDVFPRFNDVSGEYWYLKDAAEYTEIGLVGEFNSWGGSADAALIQDPRNPYRWSGYFTLDADGELKIRANADWVDNWGASGFPSGVAAKGGGNMAAKAGTYFVTFNTGTGEYLFLK